MDEWDQFPEVGANQEDEWSQFPEAGIESDVSNLPSTPNSVAERAATLPLPRPNMFASMADEEAKMTYDAYARHPETQRAEDGSLIYRGQTVPQPEGNSGFVDFFAGLGQRVFSGMSPEAARAKREAMGENPDELYLSERIGRGVGGGAINVARNIAETGVGIATSTPIPSLIDATFGTEIVPDAVKEARSDLAEGMEDTLPKYNPEGGVEGAASVGTEIAAGIVIGNKALAAAKAAGVAPTVLKALTTKVPRAASYLTKKFIEGVVTAAPTAATIDDQSDTLVTGENALIPILQGLDTNNPDEMENMINRRMNVLIDSAIVAAPIEVTADGGRKVMKFAYETFYEPIAKALSKNAQYASIMKELMDAVGLAADAADPNSPQAEAAKAKVVQILKTPEFQRMQKTIGRPGVSDIDFRRDTASAIDAGLAGDDSSEADAIRSVFRESRKQAEEMGGTKYQQTRMATERPVKAAEKLTEETEALFGSDAGIEQARTGIQTGGAKEVQDVENLGKASEENLHHTQIELPDKLREGPIGETLANAEVKPISQARQERNQMADELITATDESLDDLSKQRKVVWDNIPEGLEADEESLTEVLVDASPYLTKKMSNALKDAGFDPTAEGSVVDFKKLQQLRNPLSREIARMAKGGEKGIEELQALRDNLNNVQPEFVRDTAKKKGKAGAKALDDALDFERNVYGPDAKKGLPGEIRDLNKQRFDGPGVTKRDLKGEALHRTLTSDQPDTPKHFVDFIVKYKPEKKDLVVKYAFADASDKLLRKIKSGEGLSSVDPTDVMGSLESYRQVLNSNPEAFGKEIKELDDFYDSITRNKNDIKKLTEVVKEHAKNLAKIKQDVYEVRLNDFFEKNGDPKPNGFATLRSLYLNPQATGSVGKGKLDDVIRLAKESGDPAVLDGMKAAWMKLVRDEVFTDVPSALSGRSLSAAKTGQFLEGTGKADLRRVGQKLFEGNDQVIVEALDNLLRPALDVTVSGKSGSSKMQQGSLLNDAKEAVAAGVRLWKGPLTREGTQINTVVGKLLNYFVTNKKSEAALDAIMSNPDGFLKAYDRFIQHNEPYKERARQLFKWMVYSGIYNEGDQNQFDKALKEANQENQTQEALAK